MGQVLKRVVRDTDGFMYQPLDISRSFRDRSFFRHDSSTFKFTFEGTVVINQGICKTGFHV